MSDLLDICVVGGAGHIGLPTALLLASNTRHKVTALDINTRVCAAINQGQYPYHTAQGEPLLAQALANNFQASDDSNCLTTARIVVIAIGTTGADPYTPRTGTVQTFLEQHAALLVPDCLVVVLSTMGVGETASLYSWMQSRLPEAQLAYCPERVMQDKALEELQTVPALVSGFSGPAIAQAEALVQTYNPTTIRLTPAEAELAKLYSNAWRYLTFGLANSLYAHAESVGVSFAPLRQAMMQGYPRLQAMPAAGPAGGPCLPKDTRLLLDAMPAPIQALLEPLQAWNLQMPQTMAAQLRQTLDPTSDPLVVVLGRTFKSGSSDVRGAPSERIVQALQEQGFHSIQVIDPVDTELEDSLPAPCAAVLVATPHQAFANWRIPAGVIRIDPWGILPA